MRIRETFLVLSVTLLVASPQRLSAQETSCDIPLVVTRFAPVSGTVELVTDLTAKDLTIRVGGTPSAVKTASIDVGSKRIALILDASKKVPEDEWKLETEMALSLIENARALDRFALFRIGVDTPAGSLLPSGDLQVRLRELVSSRPAAVDENEKLYDALLAAAKLFDPPEFGDTIFLFGHPDDLGSKATPVQVEELILRNRQRFYAMSFTDLLRGLPPGFDLNKPLPKGVGQQSADEISHATGYFFSFHSVASLSIPGQLPLLEGFLGSLYAGIAQPYRLKISPNATDRAALDLVVVNGKGRNISQGDVHYPHFIYKCQPR